MEQIQITFGDGKSFREVLNKMLGIKGRKKCFVCGCKVTRKNWGGIFPPRKIICNNIICFIEQSVSEEK